MNTLTYLKEDDFLHLTNDLTIVDFYADWCWPCRMLWPILEKIVDNWICNVVKINTDDYPNLAEKYNVMWLPTMLIFKGWQLKSNPIVWLKSYDELVSICQSIS